MKQQKKCWENLILLDTPWATAPLASDLELLLASDLELLLASDLELLLASDLELALQLMHSSRLFPLWNKNLNVEDCNLHSISLVRSQTSEKYL